MAPSPISARYTNSESVFKPDIFKGKALFCTGGGSGICKEMTYAMVRSYSCLRLRRALMRLSRYTDKTRCQRVIVGSWCSQLRFPLDAPPHVWGIDREGQERTRSSLPPPSTSTLAYPKLESVPDVQGPQVVRSPTTLNPRH